MFKKVFSLIISMFMCISFCNVACYADSETKNEIPVVYATDNKYVWPTLVSMFSAVKNASPNTFFKYFILVDDNLKPENKEKFDKFQNNFKDKCQLEIVNMHDKYENCYKSRWGAAMYYRFVIPELLKDYDKCIYLDGDTNVLSDLSELYNLDISNYYLAGQIDTYHRKYCSLKNKSKTLTNYIKNYINPSFDDYICTGVILWNIKKCNEDKISNKLNRFVKDNYEKFKDHTLIYPDQDAINLVCRGKILDLPFHFALNPMYICGKKYDSFLNVLKKYITEEEWLKAKNNPVVFHWNAHKPWNDKKMHLAYLWEKYSEDLKQILK